MDNLDEIMASCGAVFTVMPFPDGEGYAVRLMFGIPFENRPMIPEAVEMANEVAAFNVSPDGEVTSGTTWLERDKILPFKNGPDALNHMPRAALEGIVYQTAAIISSTFGKGDA